MTKTAGSVPAALIRNNYARYLPARQGVEPAATTRHRRRFGRGRRRLGRSLRLRFRVGLGLLDLQPAVHLRGLVGWIL